MPLFMSMIQRTYLTPATSLVVIVCYLLNLCYHVAFFCVLYRNSYILVLLQCFTLILFELNAILCSVGDFCVHLFLEAFFNRY